MSLLSLDIHRLPLPKLASLLVMLGLGPAWNDAAARVHPHAMSEVPPTMVPLGQLCTAPNAPEFHELKCQGCLLLCMDMVPCAVRTGIIASGAEHLQDHLISESLPSLFVEACNWALGDHCSHSWLLALLLDGHGCLCQGILLLLSDCLGPSWFASIFALLPWVPMGIALDLLPENPNTVCTWMIWATTTQENLQVGWPW